MARMWILVGCTGRGRGVGEKGEMGQGVGLGGVGWSLVLMGWDEMGLGIGKGSEYWDVLDRDI